MAVREMVFLFYEKLWNEIDFEIADEILHPNVTFRGSVGGGATGHHEVCDYVRMVTTALSGYRCDIESLIAEENHVAAKVRFSGLHVGGFSDIRRLVVISSGLALRFSPEMKTNCATFGCWVTSIHFVVSSVQVSKPRTTGLQ